jgi:FKBP-type peptidyl-prolyl cis-trans isomerase FkpA
MRWLAAPALLLSFAVGVRAQDPKTDDERTVYAIGVILAKNIETFGFSPKEIELVKRGFADEAAGKKLLADPVTYGKKIGELQQERMKVAAEKQDVESKAYLAKAAKEKGAQVTSSGLVYIPIKEGTGASPQASDTVKVHYVGTLVNGEEFDSSVKRGTPAEFALKQVIPCWTEGLQKMKVGGKAKLVCPYALAYGEHGHPPAIPGKATLVFQVELLDIVKK